MAVSPEYRDWVLEQFRAFGPVTARAMFGGAGIYHEGLCFGLITSQDVAYLKVDDANRADFENAGMKPFSPYDDGRSMGYYEIPPDVLEDPDRLREWAEKAVEAARRKKR